MQTITNSTKKFITILSDGKFHQTVPEGTLGSVKRSYEDKEGVMQTKNELVFDEVIGKITAITFQDGGFGENLQLEIDGEGVISASTNSGFGEDLMKKIVGMDLALEYKFVPYSFSTDKGKNKKGVTIYLGDQKIDSFFYNPMTKETTNGFPVPDGDTKTYKSDDWKIYFLMVKKFLITEVKKLPQYKVVDNTMDGLIDPVK